MQSKRNDIIALLLSMCVPSLAALAYFVFLGESPAARVVYAVSRAFLIAFPVTWFLLVERGRVRWPTWNTRAAALGAAFALLVGAAAWTLYQYWLNEALDFTDVKRKAAALHVREHYVLFAAFLSLANSAVEEYYWRWFVFGRCRRHLALAGAAILSGLAFAAHHCIVLVVMFGSVAGAGLTLGVAIGGVFWAWLYDRYGSLYASWISHLLVDVAVMSIGYRMLETAG
ncbi:MAG: CPBP family intramembrane metalloprotease [Phycisphaerales bacterium]|nr:MAG: CPBP family intramembrane metalloprotease [Phycisphaerales bacterium]